MSGAFIAIGTAVQTGAGTPTIPYPASIANGNTLLILACQKNSANTIVAPTSALTWTEIANRSNYMKAWASTYDGSSAAPTQYTGSTGMVSVMLAFSGMDVGDLVDNFGSTSVVQTNMRFPALTLANDNEIVIAFCRILSAITSVAQPAGWTEVLDLNSSLGGLGIWIGYQIQTTKTNITQTDPVVTGSSSATAVGITLALKTAGAPAGGTPTITSISVDDVVTSTETNVNIVCTNAEAAQGTGSVVLKDGALSQTLSVVSWADTLVVVDMALGDCRYGACSIELTNNSGLYSNRGVTVNPPAGTTYADVTTLRALTFDANDVPSRVTPKLTSLDPAADIAAVQLEIKRTGGTGDAHADSDGRIQAASTVTQIELRGHHGTGWGSAITWDLREPGPKHV